MKAVAFLTPNNFNHKAGDGVKTRKRNISYIHPALQANCGATQATYLLECVDDGQSDSNRTDGQQNGQHL